MSIIDELISPKIEHTAVIDSEGVVHLKMNIHRPTELNILDAKTIYALAVKLAEAHIQLGEELDFHPLMFSALDRGIIIDMEQ